MDSLIRFKITCIVFIFLISGPILGEEKHYTIENKKMFSQSLQYDGTVIPSNVVEMVSPSLATIKAKHFNFGDYVEKDQLLFDLSSIELEARLNQAKMELLENSQGLEKLKNWKTSHEVLQAQYNVNKLKEESSHAKNHFEQTRKLFEAGIVSREEYLADERHHSDKQHQYQEAREYLSDIQKKGSKRFVKLAELKVETTKQQVEMLSSKVAMLSMRAPVSGMILPPQRQGDVKDSWGLSLNQTVFQESQPMALIAEVEQFYVHVKVDEFDVIHLAKGFPAHIFVVALGKQPLNGKIHEINVQPNATENGRKAANFDVKILIENIPAKMKEKLLMGMSAMVKFEPRALEGLLVPKKAIVYEKESVHVNLVQDDKSRKQEVVLGETTDDYVLVYEGVKAGDKVVLHS